MSPRTNAQTYNVINDADGSLIVIGVDLATARSECARLDAQSRVIVSENPALADEHGQTVRPAVTEHAGMHMGRVSRHAITTTEGVVIP